MKSKIRLGSLLMLLACAATGCAKQSVNAEASSGSTSAGPPIDETGANLLGNENFDDGTSLPWTTSFTAPASGQAAVKSGAFCLQVDNAGTNKWDAQVRHREIAVQKGHTYTVDFVAWASRDTRIRPKIGQQGPPYTEWWAPDFIELTTEPKRFVDTFVMNGEDDPTAEFAFHLGGRLLKGEGPVEICLDDVRLRDPQFKPAAVQVAADLPKVRVNQQGYLPKWQKEAVFVSTNPEAVAWELQDQQGKVVASGKTVPAGVDRYSGEPIHHIDFSAFIREGKAFKLAVGEERSFPFDISSSTYKRLKYDALNYFYHNRSGIPIVMPFAREPRWARPAGHPQDLMSCAPGSGCSYKLDVTGGWYDAGDHGKYVVNGGISLWTLLGLYERNKWLGKSAADFADRKLNIPESGNRVDDLLDEARFQLEFMLKMQVPDGEKLAGMVHHKGHDQHWTALGTPPHEDKMPRFLHPPSTAATLNLAATAAQGARIWKVIDAPFASKCLLAAEKAYAAAKQHPQLFAPGGESDGGGPYDDNYVADEFYWASIELFISSSNPAYWDDARSSPHHAKLKGDSGAESLISWQVVDGLGTISLGVVPNKSGAEVEAARRRIVQAADKYLKAAEEQGYRAPFRPAEFSYPWGSNSFVLNNMLVLALAHDFTRDDKYRAGVIRGMNHLLGMNALAKSYVTGYGENPLRNPHHRFWAKQANPALPEPPPGAVSGGPNSGLQDPYAQAAGLRGCKPQKCFIDHIESWSTNEITINWNAPFAWVSAWLDEQR